MTRDGLVKIKDGMYVGTRNIGRWTDPVTESCSSRGDSRGVVVDSVCEGAGGMETLV